MKLSEIKVTYKKYVYSDKISSSNDIAKVLYPHFKNQKNANLVEHFFVAYLDQANHVIGVHHHSKGSYTGTIVEVKQLIAIALSTGCTNIIVAHNHPSGNNTVSNADINLTKEIKQACEYFKLTLLDHLIFLSDSDKFISLQDKNLI